MSLIPIIPERTSQILPQVTITLDGQRVSIVSTIALQAPDAWAQIRQLCYEGLLAAHAQIVQHGTTAPPLVVIPGVKMGAML